LKSPSNIIVEGDLAYIELTQGKRAVIDAADVPFVRDYTWYAIFDGRKSWYAAYAVGQKLFRLHRHLMGQYVDHADRDGLNNRRSNLRSCSRTQNQANRISFGKRRYKGVFWDSTRKKWKAIIRFHRKSINIGRYDTEIEAAEAVDAELLKLHGEFAMTNKKLGLL
jgi:AP2 domain-containing protein/HNH endonuclease